MDIKEHVQTVQTKIEAAALAAQASAKQLVLTHFSNCIDDPAEYLPLAQAIFPQTLCASDGQCITLRYPAEKA